MQQCSAKFADDEFVNWACAEFDEPIRVIEDNGGAWEILTFATPGLALLIIERPGGLITTCRIQRFAQKSRADTGCLFGFGERFPTGGISAAHEAQRDEFLSAMRKNLSYVPGARRAA